MKTAKKKGTVNEVSRATLQGARISAQKARLVVDLIRGKGIEDAINALRFLPKKGARMTQKLLESAMHNAREQKGADIDRLFVSEAYVDRGMFMKRFMPRAQGRATPIHKPSAHITVVLGERQ